MASFISINVNRQIRDAMELGLEVSESCSNK